MPSHLKYRVRQHHSDGLAFWCLEHANKRAWFTSSWETVHTIACELAAGEHYPGMQWLDLDEAPSPTVVARRRAHLACVTATRKFVAIEHDHDIVRRQIAFIGGAA